MPSVPRPQCATYHCKSISIPGSVHCQEHAPQKEITEARSKFNAPYKTAAWHSIRMRQLSTNPLCAACMLDGRVEMASHVDHLFAWQKVGKHAFTANIFQSLCESHHGAKSGLEKKGIFRHYTNKATDYSLSDYDSLVH